MASCLSLFMLMLSVVLLSFDAVMLRLLMDKGTTSGCGWAANGEVFLREEKEGRCGELCGEFKGELRGESGGMNAAEPVSLEEDIAGEGEMCNWQQQIQAEKEDQCGVPCRCFRF